MLTQTELKRQLHYNPETGIFTRLVSTNRRIKVGDIAGSKHPTGYMQISINKNTYRSHRLAWLYVHGTFPKKEIDHINGVKYSNWILNLREANNQQNKFNRGAYKNNTTGFKGVCVRGNRWRAQARLNGKMQYLGYFTTPELASQVYQAFAINNHTEFLHAY